MRGEKPIIRIRAAYDAGSPPHARGKETYVCGRDLSGGITPACAGKRNERSYTYFTRQDHPRMRGEKVFTLLLGALSWGSPPHARGKEEVIKMKIEERGITPACAGKRSARARSRKPALGSPPHARGKAIPNPD